MFTINDDYSIYVTRGDIVTFSVKAMDGDTPYHFTAGDVVRIKVYGKKDAETVLLQKDFPVFENAETVAIYLTEADTKFGEVISKPKDYWYEIELNPDTNPQTIIGYSEDGAALFRLLPEGNDVEVSTPTEEDIPYVDEDLDMTSPRPVANQAVARELARLNAAVEYGIGATQKTTPQMFGAVGDGVADDSASIQDMLNAAEAGSTVFFPAGEYVLNTFGVKMGDAFGDYGALLYQKKDITVEFAAGAVLRSKVNANNTDFSALFGVVECSNIRIIGGEFVGELDEHTFTSETDTTTFTQSGLWISSSSGVVVDGLKSHNFVAGCIYVGGSPHSDNIEIRNSTAYHSHYHAIVVEGADNVRIINTTAYDANTNRAFGASIDIEGISVDDPNTNIIVDGCYLGEAEASALNINKCKDVRVRDTHITDAKLTIQPSENVFISGCHLENAKIHILQGGSKNIVVDGNKVANGNIYVQAYSSETRTLDGVVIRNNTILFDSAFEGETYGAACLQVQAQGLADITIANNVCRCASGRVCFMKAVGGSGERGVVVYGNKFSVGNAGNKAAQVYRDLFTLSNLRVDFVGNEVEMHLADEIEVVSGTSTATVINLLYCTPNGTDCFRFANNDISIFGAAATGLTEFNLLKTYTELAEAPTERYVDFLANIIFSDVPATCGLTVPVGYKTRVYNNIVASGLSALISETQSGVSSQGNICDAVV